MNAYCSAARSGHHMNGAAGQNFIARLTVCTDCSFYRKHFKTLSKSTFWITMPSGESHNLIFTIKDCWDCWNVMRLQRHLLSNLQGWKCARHLSSIPKSLI